MSTNKFHLYRGDVRAIASAGSTLAFVTVHPEGFPTAVYRLDAETLALSQNPLPTGGQVNLATGSDLFAQTLGGNDCR